jgi:acyl-coenzyme A thioesterase PaaI-like protein
MDITEVPFNHFLGIKKSPGDGPHLLELDNLPEYRNHLGTVHAGAQMALAEAASAEYLVRTFGGAAAGALAVVRRVQAKFRNLVNGKVFAAANCSAEELARFSKALDAKGKALVSVNVDILDGEGVVAMTSVIEWFVQRPK